LLPALDGGPQDGAALIRELRLAISYQCNLRCEHCYVPVERRVEYHKYFPDELTVEEIEKLLDVASEHLGLRAISITGGEPLITPVWSRTEPIMRRALENEVRVRITTGGAGQIPISDVLAAARNSDNLSFQVSLDGAEAATVNKMRGRSYAYTRATKTIGEIAARGVQVQVRYTITEANYSQTQACYDKVTELGATAFVAKPVFSTGEARRGDMPQVTPESGRELQLALARSSVGRRTKLKFPQPCYLTDADLPAGHNVQITTCRCGRDIAYVTPNGDIYPCPYVVGVPGMENWRLGNLRDSGFNLRRAWAADSTYTDFRSAPKTCHCTSQEITRVSDELLACR
jgi:radical SAM protein with 4Fe4S-binding SPASM domain